MNKHDEETKDIRGAFYGAALKTLEFGANFVIDRLKIWATNISSPVGGPTRVVGVGHLNSLLFIGMYGRDHPREKEKREALNDVLKNSPENTFKKERNCG